MDSSTGDPTTTARLSPVASTSSYFLSLDPTSGRIEIVDSSMAPPNMDLSGDETVYEIRDEDYFLTGQFMDHGLSEMDPVVDISDLLDKPLQGFLQDEPAQGTSFSTYSLPLPSLSEYVEVKGSERDTVQQAIDDAYGSGSISDPIVLVADDNPTINRMMLCVNINNSNTDKTAQVHSQSDVTIRETETSDKNTLSVDQTQEMPVSVDNDPILTISKTKVEIPPKVSQPQSEQLVITNFTMQNIPINTVQVVKIDVSKDESEESIQNDVESKKMHDPPPISIREEPQIQTEIGTDCAYSTEEIVLETPSEPLSGLSVPTLFFDKKNEPETIMEQNEEHEMVVDQNEEYEMVADQNEEHEMVVDPEIDFEIKIVSCYSEGQPEVVQESETSLPIDKECKGTLGSEPEVEVIEHPRIKCKPEVEVIDIENQQIKSEPEETALPPEVTANLDLNPEADCDADVSETVGRIPCVPEWLSGYVDPNDELLVAYKNRPDPMMTVICVFCYTWFHEKEDLQKHIVTEHAKNKSRFHKCRLCGAKFVARVLRIRHEKLHRYDLKRPWFMYAPKFHPYDSLVKNHFTKRFRPAPLSDSYRSHLNEVFNLVEKLPFECNACGDAFVDEESVREHYELSHALQSCRFCGKVPGNSIDAIQHEKEFHGQYEIKNNYVGGAWNMWEQWACEESLEKQEMISNIEFFHNYRKRLQDEPVPFEEEFIEREVVFDPNMNGRFFKTENAGSWTGKFEDGTFQIKKEQDGFYYENQGEIAFITDRQFKEEHGDMAMFQQLLPYRCDTCPKSYDNEHDLRRHARCHSGEKQPLACQYCGKGFKTHSHKKEHERTHTNEKPYCCPICNRSFIQSSNLKKHIQTHKSLNTLQCDTCGKQFIKESSLILHQRAHAQDRKFRCHICDRAYNYASLLKRHMRIHTGETPYVCDICGMLFHELVSLHYHRKKVHTGERPHCCETCGRAFILSSDLKKHVQIHLKPPTERAAKKATKRTRSQSKSLENDTGSIEAAEPSETDFPQQKFDSITEEDEINLNSNVEEVENVEDVQPDSEEESLASQPEEIVEVPIVEKPPVLRVYQRQAKPSIPIISEEIKATIENPLPELTNYVESQECNTSNDFSSQSLTNDILATDLCDKDLFSNVMEEVIEESLATIVLDESGQEIVNDVVDNDLFS